MTSRFGAEWWAHLHAEIILHKYNQEEIRRLEEKAVVMRRLGLASWAGAPEPARLLDATLAAKNNYMFETAINMLNGAPQAAEAMANDREDHLTFVYRNWRGEIATRVVVPCNIWFGHTEWHPGRQWFMRALDVEKGEERDFALKDIISISHNWRPLETAPKDGTLLIGGSPHWEIPIIIWWEESARAWWSSVYLDTERDLTSWMPLPKPPAAGGADA